MKPYGPPYPQQQVLLVEDDQKLARPIASFLSQHGFEVRQGIAVMPRSPPPRLQTASGGSRPHAPRTEWSAGAGEIRRVANLPILILTAQEDDLDHILGLESGADDYVIADRAYRCCSPACVP